MKIERKNKILIYLVAILLSVFFSSFAHALTHETVNGVDVYSMPASTTNPVELSITAADNPKHYDLIVDSIEPALFAGLEAAISKTGSFFTYLISGQLSNTNNFNAIENPKDYIIKIKDIFNAVGSKLFRLKVLNQRPVIDKISCSYTTKDGIATSTDNAIGQNLFARKNTELNCQGYAHDNDGNAIDIIFSGFPEGLSQNIDSGFLTGLLYHDTSDYAMVARPRDEFGLEGDSVSFQLHIYGTYCGDGIYQYINDEGVNEQCDGTSNIAYTPGQSYTGYYQFLMAYACNSDCQWGNDYCGDGDCDANYGENTQTCSIDCGYDIVISANTANFDLYNTARSLGWDGSRPVTLNVIINSGVYLYSTSYIPSFDTGGGYPSGVILNLTNNGYILGMGGVGGRSGSGNAYSPSPGGSGGAGGPGFQAQYPITIINNGVIAGGGGGGAGGGGSTQCNLQACYCGGAGGGGAGFYSGGGGAGCGCGGFQSNPGQSGSYFSGGGPSSPTGYRGGNAGVGGGLGQSGGSGTSGTGCGTSGPGAPGAGGAAVYNNYFITWSNSGTRYGWPFN